MATIAKERIIPKIAYQLEEKDGGFQLYKIILDNDYKLKSRERVSDPDAWEQIMTLLEGELARMFQ